MADSGGVNRDHDRSFSQKLTFALIHTCIVATCIWLAFGQIDWPNPMRARFLAFCAILYWARHCVTLFVLLKRQAAYSEVFGLSLFFAVFEIGFLLLGAGILSDGPTPLSAMDWVALALVLLGSYLNSGSELQRWQWKKQPSSKGHCYTDGLFGYATHINYFGDSVLFTGWAMLTASIFAWSITIFVIAGFVFYHIPALDKYLSKRYGIEFEEYATKTAKLIPFIY
jgi:steroid 5-alpha reductase family enzyme